jgi:hypothetical protein
MSTAAGDSQVAPDVSNASQQKQHLGSSTSNSDSEHQRPSGLTVGAAAGRMLPGLSADGAKDGSAQPPPDLDPTAVDGEGWPLLHRVVMAAATAGPGKALKPTSGGAVLPPLRHVLAACKDVNLKGPGGFTALHMACMGTLTLQQRK